MKKGDLVKDTRFPEWGNGLILTKSNVRVRVMYPASNGISTYLPSAMQYLQVVKTKEQRDVEITEAYERFCGR